MRNGEARETRIVNVPQKVTETRQSQVHANNFTLQEKNYIRFTTK